MRAFSQEEMISSASPSRMTTSAKLKMAVFSPPSLSTMKSMTWPSLRKRSRTLLIPPPMTRQYPTSSADVGCALMSTKASRPVRKRPTRTEKIQKRVPAESLAPMLKATPGFSA